MATTTLTSDIFKFMSIRPASKSKNKKKDIRYIKDERLLIDDFICAENDVDGIDLKEKIFDLVKNYICPETYKEVKAKNKELIDSLESLLGNVKSDTSIYFKDLLDDLIEAILLYSAKADFNRCNLICEVECIIKKHNKDTSFPLNQFVEDGWFDKINWELFNRLYILYIFKRKYPLNLDYIFSALRAMNVIKWLNHDNKLQPCNKDLEQNKGCLYIFGGIFQKNRDLKNKKKYIDETATHESGCEIEEPEKTVLNTLQDLITLNNANPVIHSIFAYLYFYKCAFNPIKPIGIGDLKIVREKLCKYEAGEIAHIENVLRGESKERNHRRLNRVDDIFTTESERKEENIRDTQTTERFETKKEIEKIVNEQIQANAEVSGSVSGTYGVVQYNVAASAGFSYAKATTDTNRSTSNYAKEVVNKSVNRVENRVSEQRSVRQIIETEEINNHKIDNSKSNTHVSGIYRYVDKRYKSQLYNYGKRLMFEFIIPEPAFFYKKILSGLKSNTDKIFSDTEPQKPKISADTLTKAEAEKYYLEFGIGASVNYPVNIAPIITHIDFESPENTNEKGAPSMPIQTFSQTESSDILITGKAYVQVHHRIKHNGGGTLYLTAGNQSSQIRAIGNSGGIDGTWWESWESAIGDPITITNIAISNYLSSTLSFNYSLGSNTKKIKLELDVTISKSNSSEIEKWKSDTYALIMKTYNDSLTAYNLKNRNLKAMLQQKKAILKTRFQVEIHS